MGFFASLSRGWKFMKAALAMAFQNPALLLPSVFLILTTIVYFAGWGVALFALKVDTSQNTTLAILGGIATFGSFLIFYFYCGMTVNMVDVHLKGGRPSLGAAFKDAAKNFVAICFLATISTVVELLAKAARNNRQQAGFAVILTKILQAIWTVVSFLLLPAIIVEDASLPQALRRVRKLYDGKFILIGVGEVGVRLMTGIIGFVLFFAAVFVVIGMIKVIPGAAGVITAFVVGGALLAVLAAWTTFLRMAYYTCLYNWAAEVERVGATAPAPGPLGVALAQRPLAAAA